MITKLLPAVIAVSQGFDVPTEALVSPPLIISLSILLVVTAIICLSITSLSAGFMAIGSANEHKQPWISLLLCIMPAVGICLLYIGADRAREIAFDLTCQWMLVGGGLLVFIIPALSSLSYLLYRKENIRWLWKYLIAGLLSLTILVSMIYYLYSSGLVIKQ